MTQPQDDLNQYVVKQWRAINKYKTPVYFTSEEAMREQAPRVARYVESDLILQTTRDITPGLVLTAANQFVDIGTVVWDRQEPDENPTKLVEFEFTGRVTVKARAYDHSGVERNLPSAIHSSVHDTLHSMTFEEPEPDDLLQSVVGAMIQGFTIVSITDTDADPES